MEFLMMMKLKNQEVVQRIDYPILLYILIFFIFHIFNKLCTFRWRNHVRMRKRNKKRIHSGQTLNPFIQKQLQFQAKVDNECEAYAWGSTSSWLTKCKLRFVGFTVKTIFFDWSTWKIKFSPSKFTVRRSGRSAAPSIKPRLKQSCKFSKVCLFRE